MAPRAHFFLSISAQVARSSLSASQKQVAERDGAGEDEEDLAEHWWPPHQGKPGGQQPADCGGPLLEHHGGGGDVHVSRKLKETQMEGQQWLESQV